MPIQRSKTYRALQAGAAAICLTLMAACGGGGPSGPPPAPQALTDEAIGHYCGMNLTEHTGPKGQILLRDQDTAVWFSTIREVFAYTLLPEEPKTITAIYVQDMGQADSHGNPPAHAWIDARSAHFLIDSSAIGGMGAPDALPFADLKNAEAYAQNHGGRIVSFQDMPEDYVLRYQEPASSALRLTDIAPTGGSS